MERDAAVDDDTPMEPRRESPAWVRTARLTFLHHARGDWLLPLSLLAFVGPALALAGLFVTDSFALSHIDGWALFAGLHGILPVLMPVALLLMTLSTFRGAWLLDPEAPAERLGGFLAGTAAALAVALVPWALMGVVLAALLGDAPGGLLAAPVHLAAALLHAAAWVAIFLLVGVAVRDAETRWVAAGVAWAFLVPVLGHLRDTALTIWRYRSGADFFAPLPWWSHALAALAPAEVYRSLVRVSTDAPAMAFDGSAFAAVSVLLAWVVVPLAAATFLQARRARAA